MLDRTIPWKTVGDNHPPSPIQLAKEAATALSSWLTDHPVIESQEDAREGKLQIDRVKSNLDDMERERDGKVRPLNEQVAGINASYRTPRTILEDLLVILKTRLTSYAREMERQRMAAAEAAEAKRAEAERIARELDRKAQEATLEAQEGVCVDIGQATIEADQAFAAFEKAGREAARAERETKVRITGGYGHAISLRTHETLIVTDWRAAIAELSAPDDVPPEGITAAILTAARALKKATGSFPAGISSTSDRHI